MNTSATIRLMWAEIQDLKAELAKYNKQAVIEIESKYEEDIQE